MKRMLLDMFLQCKEIGKALIGTDGAAETEQPRNLFEYRSISKMDARKVWERGEEPQVEGGKGEGSVVRKDHMV